MEEGSQGRGWMYVVRHSVFHFLLEKKNMYVLCYMKRFHRFYIFWSWIFCILQCWWLPLCRVFLRTWFIFKFYTILFTGVLQRLCRIGGPKRSLGFHIEYAFKIGEFEELNLIDGLLWSQWNHYHSIIYLWSLQN